MKRLVASGALVAASVLALAGCGGEATSQIQTPSPSPTSLAPLPKVDLTVGVWGNKAEVGAYRSMVDVYNAVSTNSTVKVESWPDHDDMVTALSQEGATLPDVFLASRRDLSWLQAEHLNRPVDELLDERNVDFGDGYSRDALEGFSADRKLQCMPYAVSPTVVYYNTRLVNFAAMAKRGLDVPADTLTKWNFDQFRAAVQFASRPKTGAKGIAVDPTLDGLAPFIYAAGGKVYNDPVSPTSLDFSSDATRSALDTVLPVFRDPRLTLSQKQLASGSPLDWFKRGKVAMITGTRALVPQLRHVKGLRFDVLPIPTIDHSATTGDVTGLCLSARSRHVVEAADLLAYAVSPDSVRLLARTGYVVPANQQVALSDDFTQTPRQPAHASVFTSVVRTMVMPPLIEDIDRLEAVVAGPLGQLINAPGVLDLDAVTERIDTRSAPVLAPQTSSASPSDPAESSDG